MLMAVLEGRAPNRRPHCATEVAVSHLAAAAERTSVSSQGGLGRIIIYVSGIVALDAMGH